MCLSQVKMIWIVPIYFGTMLSRIIGPSRSCLRRYWLTPKKCSTTSDQMNKRHRSVLDRKISPYPVTNQNMCASSCSAILANVKVPVNQYKDKRGFVRNESYYVVCLPTCLTLLATSEYEPILICRSRGWHQAVEKGRHQSMSTCILHQMPKRVAHRV